MAEKIDEMRNSQKASTNFFRIAFKAITVFLITVSLLFLVAVQLTKIYAPGSIGETIQIQLAKMLHKFPAPRDAENIDFYWNFKDRPYRLSLTVYGSIYDFYKNGPKGLFADEMESSIKRYLTLPVEDHSIKELTSKLNSLAARDNLSEDQKLEMAVSFVQSIPYDSEKAQTDRTHPRYPYEVLFDNKGVCSDKSFLMYTILTKMGYGGSIFAYPQQKHMNVGVQSPAQYSTDNSGYSIIETTNPKLKIGVIPNLDSSSGQALEQKSLQLFNLRNPNTMTGKQLSAPEIYAKTKGKQYSGMIQTFQNQRRLADTQDFLERQKPIIEQKQTRIAALRQQMNNYRAANNYSLYNSQVPSYNQLVNELKFLIDDYNAKVAQYNNLVGEM